MQTAMYLGCFDAKYVAALADLVVYEEVDVFDVTQWMCDANITSLPVTHSSLFWCQILNPISSGKKIRRIYQFSLRKADRAELILMLLSAFVTQVIVVGFYFGGGGRWEGIRFQMVFKNENFFCT